MEGSHRQQMACFKLRRSWPNTRKNTARTSTARTAIQRASFPGKEADAAVTATLGHTPILLAFCFAALGDRQPDSCGALGQSSALFGLRPLCDSRAIRFGDAGGHCLDLRLWSPRTFRIRYVAFNTTRATPIYYRVTGLWGALEGSLLLWEWILIIFSGLVAWIYRDRHTRDDALGAHGLFHCLGFFSWRRRLSFPILSKSSRRCRSTAAVSIRCSKTPI